MKPKGKNLLCTQDWSQTDLMKIFQLAIQMKRDRFNPDFTNLLANKSFLMFFYNSSLRTHVSFETALTQLGGHAQYRNSNMGYPKNSSQSSESVNDVAKVISGYVDGIGIRMMLDSIPYYGAGHQMLLNFSEIVNVPVINMADDYSHPCQALSDLMGWAEWWGKGIGMPNFENLKGKKLLVTWARSSLTRPCCSVQSPL